MSVTHWLLFVIAVALYLVPIWKIVAKAGYSGALSLVMFIPLVNVVMLYVFAFSRWPIEKAQ